MEDYDTVVNELNVVRRKLESKEEALTILNEELKKCQNERDRFKKIAEHSRHHFCSFSVDEKSLSQMITSLKETNKCLEKDLVDTTRKFEESQGDNKLLREQISKQRQDSLDGETSEKRFLPPEERENLIKNLETLKTKYVMLERDLQMVLDDKEELIGERDAYKSKVERLNHQLNYVLKGDEKRIVDVDTLVMENRYLQDRLKQIQEEKSLYLQTLSKYKQMLEKRRNHGTVKFGANTNGAMVITHRQVQQMLHLSQLPTTQTTIHELRSLASALFESLSDKTTALTHQKKANKILGSRVTELENKIKQMEIGVWEAEKNKLIQAACVLDSADFTLEDTCSSPLSDLCRKTLESSDCDDVSSSPECFQRDDTDGESTNLGELESTADDKHSISNKATTEDFSLQLQDYKIDQSGTRESVEESIEEESDELPPALMKLVEAALQTLNEDPR